MRAVPLCLALLALARHTHAQGRLSWRVGPGEGEASPAPAPPTVAAIALSIKSRAIQDSRCYLMNGGAVESFFISEDTPVGSTIGTLSVNGDPGEEQGDITLRLQEKGAAVGILPGTKNLTLLRALDREEKRGPSNVYVNVRCDRRRTTDPSFIIPVSIRVWDVNDNAPVWQGAPYRVRLSELTAVGTRVAVGARATDADQPGPHATIHYSVLPGPHSEYLGFPNELDSVLIIKKPLDYETLNNFTVTLRAQDAGSPPLHNDTTLHVLVLDADDQNPKFSHEHYTAVLPDDAREGTLLPTSPGPISAVDQDAGINAPLQYSATGDNARLLLVDKDTGQVAATQLLLQELNQPVTVVIKATQVDNSDRYALATLSIRRSSTGSSTSSSIGSSSGGGVRFRRKMFSAAVSEAAAPGHVVLTLHTVPPASAQQNNLQFYVSDRSFLDKFAINSAGEVVLRRALDYETNDSYHYQVMLTDGITNDTASVNISVVNVNEWEPRFKYPQYEFRVEDDSADDTELLPVGKLDVFDGDKQDSVTLTLRGSGAEMLYVNSSGEMFLRSGALRMLNSSVLHVVATAIDSGAPPRQTSVPVTVHVSERLLQAAGGGAAADGSGAGAVVLLMFAGALAALAVLVCALLLYIYRVRRRSKQSSGYVSHEKPLPTPAPSVPPTPAVTTTAAIPATGVSGTIGATGASGAAIGAGTLRTSGSAGSLLSVSAGASTILANSTSSLDLQHDAQHNAHHHTAATNRQSQRFPRSKVAPLAPTLSPSATGVPPGGAGGVSLMSDHLCGREAGRSGVAWPSATIPARVKKLSWDDAAHDQHKWGGGDGRHQPLGRRPHEPHRVLLTRGLPEQPPGHNTQEYGLLRSVGQELARRNRNNTGEALSGVTSSIIESLMNRDQDLPGEVAQDRELENTASSRTKQETPVNTHQNFQTSDPLNTIGIPIYNNLAGPSPSNYPTMVIDHTQNLKLTSKDVQYMNTSHKVPTKHLKPPNKQSQIRNLPSNRSFKQPSTYALPVSNQGGSSARSTVTPTAPIMYEDSDPLHLSGPPPAYATIDPKKLRTRHIRPVIFKHGVVSRRYQLL
ncbi:protocadherin Fat 4-like Cad96Ca isoform X2 [Anticarsia gemmatalis]|uniref:protocadherin Fat 4-like Cad96Ca isoform X2 n=1 Tax=Anticarsia gemmatalis TaxID=129554 RepID=UPI003F75EABA